MLPIDPPHIKKTTNSTKWFALALIVVAGVAAAILLNLRSEEDLSDSSTSTITKSPAVIAAVSYTVTGSTGTLTLPHVGATVQLPTATWPLTASDVAQFNDPAQSWHDCGTIMKESPEHSGIWISYGQFGACATENSFPMVENTLFAAGARATCDRLRNSELYIGAEVEFAECQTMAESPTGFRGVTFYEFIPDYTDTSRGTVVRVHQLESTANPAIRFIFTFIPQISAGASGSIARNEFGEVIRKITAGTDTRFSSSNADYNTFEYTVRSLRMPMGT